MHNPFDKTNKVCNSETIDYIKKYKKEIDTFEIKDEDTGFKFIYPIKNSNEVVGFLAITFSEQGLTSSLMKQYYVLTNLTFAR